MRNSIRGMEQLGTRTSPGTHVEMRKGRSPLLALLLALFLLLYFVLFIPRFRSLGFAWDFAINWTAARGALGSISLYDRSSQQQLAVSAIGPFMDRTFLEGKPFTGYIGPPTTALLFLPFTALSYSPSANVYRGLIVVLFFGSVILAGYSLPQTSRVLVWVVGSIVLITMAPVVVSVSLGQVDAWVVLALAIALLSAGRKQWIWVGVALGFATGLKITPGIAIIYCMWHRKWSVLLGASLTAIVGVALTVLAGRTTDIPLFFESVLPAIAQGTLDVQNQSVAGFLARLILPETRIYDFWLPLDSFRYISLVTAAFFGFLLFLADDTNEPSPLGMMASILAGLLIGPVTWDHYASWAVVFAVASIGFIFQSGPSREKPIVFGLLILGGILFAFPSDLMAPSYLSPEFVAANSWVRLTTGFQTLALSAWFAGGILQLWGARRTDKKTSQALASDQAI